MAKGLRFFGTDFANTAFGGSPTASSAIANSQFAFDGILGTKWISNGENTDGDQVDLEMDYGVNRIIDSFFIIDTNIEDIEAQYHDGSSWVTASSSIATILKSADLSTFFVKLNASVTAGKVRVVGGDTITENEEKFVSQFLTFSEIGQFEFFPDFRPSFNPKQNVFSLTDGKGFVIERGETLSAKIELKSHINQNDIDLAEILLARKEPFYIWANGGDDSIFSFSFRPYKFEDLFKVTIVGRNDPKFSRNYYKSGYNNIIDIIEVV